MESDQVAAVLRQAPPQTFPEGPPPEGDSGSRSHHRSFEQRPLPQARRDSLLIRLRAQTAPAARVEGRLLFQQLLSSFVLFGNRVSQQPFQGDNRFALLNRAGSQPAHLALCGLEARAKQLQRAQSSGLNKQNLAHSNSVLATATLACQSIPTPALGDRRFRCGRGWLAPRWFQCSHRRTHR